MTTKGEMTKAYILENAKGLFGEKGYGSVTMKDFCDRCHLSRGGLYRYFVSTKEIFQTMLTEDLIMVEKSVDRWLSEEKSPIELMRHILSFQVIEILKGEGALDLAIYEYCKLEKDRSFISNRLDSSKRILIRVLDAAMKEGEILIQDAEKVAVWLLQHLEGVRISSNIITYSEEVLMEDLMTLLHLYTKQHARELALA